jgi:hypothetical protein
MQLSRMSKMRTTPVITEAFGTIKKGYLQTSVVPRPPVSHRTTVDHTNQQSMHHS